MTDSDETDNLGFSRCSYSQNTVVCSTLTAGANSFLSCPLVERAGKSQNVSFHIVHTILEGESLTTAMKVEGKVPAAKRRDHSQKLT